MACLALLQRNLYTLPAREACYRDSYNALSQTQDNTDSQSVYTSAYAHTLGLDVEKTRHARHTQGLYKTGYMHSCALCEDTLIAYQTNDYSLESKLLMACLIYAINSLKIGKTPRRSLKHKMLFFIYAMNKIVSITELLYGGDALEFINSIRTQSRKTLKIYDQCSRSIRIQTI